MNGIGYCLGTMVAVAAFILGVGIGAMLQEEEDKKTENETTKEVKE